MKPVFPPTRFFYLLPLLGLLLAGSCTMRETRQEGAVSYEPRFRIKSVDAASLGTLDVLPLRQPGDVDLPRRNQLIQGYVNRNLPLKMTVSLNVFNPNLEPAAMTGIDYTVLIDGKVLGNGRMPMTTELPATDSVTLPLAFEMNTYKLLGDDALPTLRNFALGFGDPRRERMTLRLRPIMRSQRGRLSVLIRRRPVVVAEGIGKPIERNRY